MVLGPVLTVASALSSAPDLQTILKLFITYNISFKHLCFMPTSIIAAFSPNYCSFLLCLYLEININQVQLFVSDIYLTF